MQLVSTQVNKIGFDFPDLFGSSKTDGKIDTTASLQGTKEQTPVHLLIIKCRSDTERKWL